MRVTAIIPAYNCAPYLPDAIRSVLAQSRAVDELIVVDDGSTDETVEVVKPWGADLVYVATANQGVAAARNEGLQRATGDVLAFLDADDTWHARKIEIQLQVLERLPDVQAVCSDFSLVCDRGFELQPRFVKQKYRVFKVWKLDWFDIFPGCITLDLGNAPPLRVFYGDGFRGLFLGNFVNTSSMMLRRTAVERAGQFSVGRATQEDYEYWLRVAFAGPMAFIDSPLLTFRRRPDQLTADDQKLRIALDTMNVVQGMAGHARERLGDGIVSERLADRHRALGLAYLAIGDEEAARAALKQAWAEKAQSSSAALYLWSRLPAALRRWLRDQRRAWQS